ncbi:MAG: Gfo/Idh/MocA family oxidoreductase [Candidatus Nanohaloarchaea archaeon]
MRQLKIYQIGLGSFGRYGFEKMVELHNHFEEVNVRLCGVSDKDFDRLEAAEKFAARNGIELETFSTDRELYEAAMEEDGEVMVYDAGPSEAHSDHIYRSLQNGFYHLAEKPPSLAREEHRKEKELARDRDVFYKVDFIERESPVVKKALELLEGEGIDAIKVFRESSIGAQKVLQPVERQGVKGGDILDKMTHEVYVLDFLEVAGEEPVLEIEGAEARYFMPKKPGSEKMMALDGGIAEEIDEKTATGRTSAAFDASGAGVELHSSWLGLSDEARDAAARIKDATGAEVTESGYSQASRDVFLDEEARFFIVEGSRNLAGDMLHKKLYDLDTGEEIDTPDLMHDQLYRVIEKAVLAAAGKDAEAEIGEKEVDVFMEALFDVRDHAIDGAGDYLEELEAANSRLREMIVEDEEEEEEVVA